MQIPVLIARSFLPYPRAFLSKQEFTGSQLQAWIYTHTTLNATTNPYTSGVINFLAIRSGAKKLKLKISQVIKVTSYVCSLMANNAVKDWRPWNLHRTKQIICTWYDGHFTSAPNGCIDPPQKLVKYPDAILRLGLIWWCSKLLICPVSRLSNTPSTISIRTIHICCWSCSGLQYHCRKT